MIKVKYNDGGFLAILFNFFGIGMTRKVTKQESSITITFKLGKGHTFFTLAWI